MLEVMYDTPTTLHWPRDIWLLLSVQSPNFLRSSNSQFVLCRRGIMTSVHSNHTIKPVHYYWKELLESPFRETITMNTCWANATWRTSYISKYVFFPSSYNTLWQQVSRVQPRFLFQGYMLFCQVPSGCTYTSLHAC